MCMSEHALFGSNIKIFSEPSRKLPPTTNESMLSATKRQFSQSTNQQTIQTIMIVFYEGNENLCLTLTTMMLLMITAILEYYFEENHTHTHTINTTKLTCVQIFIL